MDFLQIIYFVILFCLGAVFGSFACCQAWRIRLKQTGKKSPGKWSVCLSCGKRLKSSENIPVFSWLIQKGKCKSCGAKIGIAEILAELSLGVAFVAVGGVFRPGLFRSDLLPANGLALAGLVPLLLLLATLVIMWILLIYDAKWQSLPTFLLTFLNACAIMYVILRFVGQLSDVSALFFTPVTAAQFGIQNLSDFFANLALSALILGGTYFFLYAFSKEKLVGSGDWLVALPIGLILGHWWLALIALFVANFLGSIFGLYKKLRYKEAQIPFAPFLCLAFVIVYSAQSFLLTLA